MGWSLKRRGSASRVQVRQTLQPPPGAPATATLKPERLWFEAQGAPVVERNRYFLICLGLLIALTAACIALALMAPLKTVVPFVLEKSEEGAVQPAPQTAQQYQPGTSEKRYFIAQWVRQLLTIDPPLTERYLSEAYRVTRGKATVEFTDWVQRTAPMAGREKFVLTIHFATVPPKTEEELLSNPIGLYVTHFLVNADLEK